MEVAVTGGSGFIGTFLCKKLLKEKISVRVIDIAEPEINDRNLKFIKTDLTNFDQVQDSLKGVDSVYHLAGVVLKGMKQNPYLGTNLNIMGTTNVLEACVKLGIKNILFASTFYVYDCVNDKESVDEESNLNILGSDFFGASKLMAELLVKRYSEKFNLNYSIFRFGSVYGPGKSSNSVRNFLMGALENKEIVIWGKGERSNQFTYVEDIADACFLTLDKEVFGETFNFVSPETTKTKELADLVSQRFGGKFKFDLDKKEGQSFVYMSSDKAQNLLNWTPRSLSDCIEEVYLGLKKDYISN